jgi:putative FmdB family regulatory protein
MPIYEYRCDKCDKSRELVASIVQKYEVTCDNCNVPMWRVWHPTPAIFKGEGWAGKKSPRIAVSIWHHLRPD